MLSVLQQDYPDATIRVWCDAAFYRQTADTISSQNRNIVVETIISGKFRRYSSLSFLQQLRRFRTIGLPNLIDFFKIIAGIFQSVWKLIVWRPDVVFCKGGFVSLPVGFASAFLRIPMVLHDSDTHPGLANRVLARFATKIATGSTLDHYPYPIEKSVCAGIPLASEYKPYTKSEQSEFASHLGFIHKKPLVVITGGGLGSQKINSAIVTQLPVLTKSCNIVLISGELNYEQLKIDANAKKYADSFQLRAYVSSGMYKLLAASDLVVTRGGATTLLELAALAKPTIIIPNPYLTAGHQVKNAKEYESEGAAIVLDEFKMDSNPDILPDAILRVVGSMQLQEKLSASIRRLARPFAAKTVSRMIIESIKK